MALNQIKDPLLQELDSLLTGFWLTDLANFSAFFYEQMERINWLGFYLNDGKCLRLGPFQGKYACVEIAFNRGVCGAAFRDRKSLIVPDVSLFPGHIACDPKSRSELVIPIEIEGFWVGVLDVDSPIVDRFQFADLQLLTEAVKILCHRNPKFRGYPTEGF